MLRRLIILGLAAALTGPILVTPPATAAVLFSCNAIVTSPTSPSSAVFYQPGGMGQLGGLSHTRAAQDVSIRIEIFSCSNSDSGTFFGGIGGTQTTSPITTYPPKPLGCPVAWGGAGPDYADQTPILIGPTDPSFYVGWSDAGSSTGIGKVKQGIAGDQWRVVFNITAGKYAPPAGKKTKVKGALNIAPHPGSTYSSADDLDPLEQVDFSLPAGGSLIVTQK